MRVYHINERYEVADRFNKIFYDFEHLKEYVNTRENLWAMKRFFNGERLLIDIEKFTTKLDKLHFTPGDYWLDIIKKLYTDEGAELFYELTYYGAPENIEKDYKEISEIIELKKNHKYKPRRNWTKWTRNA